MGLSIDCDYGLTRPGCARSPAACQRCRHGQHRRRCALPAGIPALSQLAVESHRAAAGCEPVRSGTHRRPPNPGRTSTGRAGPTCPRYRRRRDRRSPRDCRPSTSGSGDDRQPCPRRLYRPGPTVGSPCAPGPAKRPRTPVATSRPGRRTGCRGGLPHSRPASRGRGAPHHTWPRPSRPFPSARLQPTQHTIPPAKSQHNRASHQRQRPDIRRACGPGRRSSPDRTNRPDRDGHGARQRRSCAAASQLRTCRPSPRGAHRALARPPPRRRHAGDCRRPKPCHSAHSRDRPRPQTAL